MTTSELKQQIDKVLGNSIRCLLPSYWWKRLFHQVADRIDEVEQKMDNLPEGVPIVSSESALNMLDVPIGSLASIANKKTMKFSECYVLTDEDSNLTDEEIFAKLTPVTGIEMNFPLPDISTADTRIQLVAEGGAGILTISKGLCQATFALVGETQKNWILSSQTMVDRLNEYLSQQKWYFFDDPEKVGAENMALFDQIFTIVDCSSDVYVKGLAWDRLAKEGEIGSAMTSSNTVLFYKPSVSGLSNNQKQVNAESYRKLIEGYSKDEFYDVKVHGVYGVMEATLIVDPNITDGLLRIVFLTESDTGWSRLSVSSDGSAAVEQIELHDAEMSDTSTNAVQNKVITAALNNKVDKVEGKQLSTEDFTTTLKNKLEGLSNYDDTELSEAVARLRDDFNSLTQEDISAAIENFNEIISFLEGIEDSESLDSIIASIEQQIANKQDKIEDIETIRSGAAFGATALQEHQDISHLATKEEVTNLQNEVIANEEVVASAFNDVNDRLNALSENVSGTTVTKEEFESTVTTLNESITTKADATATNEAITGLQTSVNGIGESLANYATTEALNTKITNITNEILTNEEITATALTNLDARIKEIIARLDALEG